MSSSGYLLIADITGYTTYLNDSELDHARGVLEGLMQSLVDGLETPFRLSNIQGDAVFCSAPADVVVQGQGVVDSVERLYVAFRAALEGMVRNTSCPCRACSNIAGLDLKCVLHLGEYAAQTVGGREELSGPEVIVVHRLLKNSVSEGTGVRACLLVTDAAAQASGLCAYFVGAVPHSETVEQRGAVAGRVRDLAPVWAAWQENNRVRVAPDDPERWFFDAATLPVSLSTAWAYATDPEQRFRWVHTMTGVRMEGTDAGRIGPSTVYHCAHGRQQIEMIVTDWRPFEYVTLDTPLPFGVLVRTTIEFDPAHDGTTVRTLVASEPARRGVARWCGRVLMALIKKSAVAGFAKGAENMVRIARSDGASVGRPA